MGYSRPTIEQMQAEAASLAEEIEEFRKKHKALLGPGEGMDAKAFAQHKKNLLKYDNLQQAIDSEQKIQLASNNEVKKDEKHEAAPEENLESNLVRSPRFEDLAKPKTSSAAIMKQIPVASSQKNSMSMNQVLGDPVCAAILEAVDANKVNRAKKMSDLLYEAILQLKKSNKIIISTDIAIQKENYLKGLQLIVERLKDSGLTAAEQELFKEKLINHLLESAKSKEGNILAKEQGALRWNKFSIQTTSMHKAIHILGGDPKKYGLTRASEKDYKAVSIEPDQIQPRKNRR